MPPRGRRPGQPGTRDELVATARRMFAEGGYDKTSLRDIAAAARVDPALIRHYFGSKADLFRTTVGWPFDPEQFSRLLLDDGTADLAERLTAAFFEFWEQPDTRSPLLAILRGAATHEESASLVRQFIEQRLYPQIATALGGADAELRVDLAMGQLLGIAYLRHILRIEPIASQSTEELIARAVPAVRAHLVES
ncbi:TetR/AcrR family transcriptional regulator [Mycolicibacterium alvei]|uniref:TetR family transcriptional regulator n=1 Tax=Mycolicibacterium alvei TaxID=67081 RepID=A0A6N4UUN0_9MYCO|nr:TetR family transcriptional regulator [Mycolicibacterium alvei]MCV7001015.1 TetR/AcrR family transcriptional regulator [Mycolicibacterium alvei]BBX27251.1 TetR family transcriptional regulator [Mycolicibacterium alvei]